MPYDLFWNGPISAFDYYLKKAKIESMRKDSESWANGHYMILAIQEALNPKSRIFPKKPMLEIQEEKKKLEQQSKSVTLYERLCKWQQQAKKNLNKKQQKEAQAK